MTRHDVDGDVRGLDAVPDDELDRFISGGEPSQPDLEPLASVLADLRAEGARPIGEEAATQHLEAALEAALEAFGDQDQVEPLRHRPRSQAMARIPRRRMAAAAAVLTMLFGTAGVAVAADGSAPGDLLYGLDRALERVGILDRSGAERIREAQKLVERNRVAEGLDHAAAVVAGLDGRTGDDTPDGEDPGSIAGAADTLRHAAEQVRAGGDEASLEAREAAASLLEYLAEAKRQGNVHGATVSEMVRAVAGLPEDVPAGPPPGVPAGPPGPPLTRPPGIPPGNPIDPPGPRPEVP